MTNSITFKTVAWHLLAVGLLSAVPITQDAMGRDYKVHNWVQDAPCHVMAMASQDGSCLYQTRLAGN